MAIARLYTWTPNTENGFLNNEFNNIIAALNTLMPGSAPSGTYTPTATGVANVTSTTVSLHQWMRVGNVVTVSGAMTVTATAAGSTQFRLSLPITSDITAGSNLGGAAVFTTGAANLPGTIQGDPTNDAALFLFFAAAGVTYTARFSYTYLVQ